MSDLRFVTHCGLYCGLCSARSRIPGQAQALRETIVREGYDDWGRDLPHFTGFRAFLDICATQIGRVQAAGTAAGRRSAGSASAPKRGGSRSAPSAPTTRAIASRPSPRAT
jgi:hypothetical protein